MITIIEPFLGVLVSSLAKRAVGQSWNMAQTIELVLELLVDYIILIFLVFMATTYSTNNLKYVALSKEVVLSKEGWAFGFILIIICSALCWKQSRKKVFATVQLKSEPNWLMCLAWNIPNLIGAYVATQFLFSVVAQ